eukprot:gb/GECG01000173.1/.p1 GENE.gb/GECG01000173.1/~~gb/GECG01000173.1/.p1  ORF type:complete len:290 (+),score=39.70 gb/GECG01000173.1/:1-870(+)
MFSLVEVKDAISSDPCMLGRDFRDVLIQCIDSKYANRVLPGVGLVICFYDFVRIGDAELFHGEATPHTQVHFRLLVFQPFEDELIIGTVKMCIPEGIIVSMGLFSDILIPVGAMQPSSEYICDEAIVEEPVWLWKYHDDEEDEVLEYYIEAGKSIRFRLLSTLFQRGSKDVKPLVHLPQEEPHEGTPTTNGQSQTVDETQNEVTNEDEGKIVAGGVDAEKEVSNSVLGKLGLHSNTVGQTAPRALSDKPSTETMSSLWPSHLGKEPAMLITGSIAEDGLGMLHWWEGED